MILRKESAFILVLLGLSMLPYLTHAQTLISVLSGDQETSSFAKALENTGLDQQLTGIGPYTVFAPSNEAFESFSSGMSTSSSRMRRVLLNHIMTGLATERSIRAMNKVTSLGGITLNIENRGSEVLIGNARLVQSNIRAGNGVVHIIDRVLR